VHSPTAILSRMAAMVGMCRFAEIKKASNSWPIKTRLVHKPIPVKPQRRPQERREKLLALVIIEPRPTLHRGFKQIKAPHFACL
jgi:hypothetical protein